MKTLGALPTLNVPRATKSQCGDGLEPQQGLGTREPGELTPPRHPHFHHYYKKSKRRLKNRKQQHPTTLKKPLKNAKKTPKISKMSWKHLIIPVEHLQSCSLPRLTSKTSSSNILVPKTMMPLTSMMGCSLRSRNLVIFFLQSSTKVTFFFCTLRATRCHLREHGPQTCQAQPWALQDKAMIVLK